MKQLNIKKLSPARINLIFYVNSDLQDGLILAQVMSKVDKNSIDDSKLNKPPYPRIGKHFTHRSKNSKLLFSHLFFCFLAHDIPWLFNYFILDNLIKPHQIL